MNKHYNATLEEIIAEVDYDSSISSTEQIEEIMELNHVKYIIIDNIYIKATEFINKLSRVELTLLKQGEKAAAKKWYDLGLPEPQ